MLMSDGFPKSFDPERRMLGAAHWITSPEAAARQGRGASDNGLLGKVLPAELAGACVRVAGGRLEGGVPDGVTDQVRRRTAVERVRDARARVAKPVRGDGIFL